MACHAGDDHRRLLRCLYEISAQEGWVLVIFVEQRIVDHLGRALQGTCSDRVAAVPGSDEHQRRT